MNSDIEKGKKEYDNENYEKALKYFDKVPEDDENYFYMLIYKINSMMELKNYGECLNFLDKLMGDFPYEKILWYEKIRCHLFLKQNDDALKALGEFERLVGDDDKYFILSIAKFYDWLGDDEAALKFCNKALALDEDYEEAIQSKAQIATGLKNQDMMVECGEKLIELANGDVIKLMLPFVLNLFVEDYRRCYEIIQMMDNGDDEIDGMLKSVIYQNMMEDLDVEIKISESCDWGVDDALNLLFKYKYEGIEKGIFKGISYQIS